MDYHSEFARRLNDPDFQELVSVFISVIQQQGMGREREPTVVTSALLYVSALIYEGSPYYRAEKRLDEAIAVSGLESEMMLKYLRQMREQYGDAAVDRIWAIGPSN